MNLLQITSVQDSFQQMQQVAADVEPQAAMNALDGYLTENCCGSAARCAPICDPEAAAPRATGRKTA